MVKYLAAALVIMLSSRVAGAGIVGTSGDAVPIPAPTSVVPPDHAEDGVIHVFAEQSNVPVPIGGLQADMTVPYTTYDPPNGRTLATIPATTLVNSYYIHFDPVTAGGTAGTVTFGERILGVIAEGDAVGFTAANNPPGNTLEPSNVLGSLTTSYPGAPQEQLGIEDAPDRLRLYESSVSMFFGAGSPGDRVRVLTDATGLPVLCGNGAIDPGESCDDGGIGAGDGCFGCEPEYCYACAGPGPTCTPITTCTNGDGCCAPGCKLGEDDDCSGKCTVGKVNCVIKKKTCRLKCYQGAAAHGLPVSALCLSRCSGKFDGCFLNYELKGGCTTMGDAAAIEAKVDAFVTDVVSELDVAPLDDRNKCRAQKLKAVSKYDKCVLTLHATAARYGRPIPPNRLEKCQLKFGMDFVKYEPQGECETVGDTFPLQNKDDAFIGDVTCELGLCP